MIYKMSQASFTSGPIPEAALASREALTAYVTRQAPRVVLVCFRNVNQNVVVYEAQVDSQGKFVEDAPLVGYWLELEPSYRESRRAQGLLHDRGEFSRLDRSLAWSFQVQPVPNTPPCTQYHVKFLACPQHVLTLRQTKRGRPLLGLQYGGQSHMVRVLNVEADTSALKRARSVLSTLATTLFGGSQEDLIQTFMQKCVRHLVLHTRVSQGPGQRSVEGQIVVFRAEPEAQETTGRS